jgi:hypothetical protein
LNAINDLCETEPNAVRKYFADIFVLMGKIHEKKDIEDDGIRVLAFEILITMIEKKKDLLKGDIEKAKVLIQANFKYALEIEGDITNEWLAPKGESYMEEEIIEEDKLRTSMTFLERIITVMGDDNILPFISECIMTLLGNTQHWKYRYLALMTISQIAEHVKDLSHIEPIFKV